MEIKECKTNVKVVIGGETVANSDNAMELHEGSIAPRIYIPAHEIRMDLLERTSTSTTCPIKGEAAYWNVKIGDKVYTDIAWAYLTPIPSCEKIAGLICFYNEKVDAILFDDNGQ